MSGLPAAALALLGVGAFCAGMAADLPAWLRARSGRFRVALAPGSGRRALGGGALGLLLAAVSWFALALPVASVLAVLAGAGTPFLLERSRAQAAARELERAWSGALDQLADALEAGLAFPAAAGFVAASGPPALRPCFARLLERIRRGELEGALDELAAEPGASARASAALLRAALVELPTGGLAPLLRELARVGRERFESAERARVRALSLRREATILAASPLCFLALIGWSSPGYLAAYRSAGGTIVSLAGALAIGACYLAMLRLGRIPEPGRGARR